MSIVTRFAPSPTGFLHLGHAYSALTAWRRARQAGGVFRLRLEDIDTARCRPHFAAAIAEDLTWLGLDWDGEIRVQSAHLPDYQAALETLAARELLYPCFCSRAEITAAQSAPHGAANIYPGTCRNLLVHDRASRIAAGAAYALRLNVTRALAGSTDLAFVEEGFGTVPADPSQCGDVVLARRDISTSYHLCVVHDDAAQHVTHVIRGADLRQATHIHVLLQRLLGLQTPIYAHHPLFTDASGKRLAKRDHAATLRAMREAGITQAQVLADLAGPAISGSVGWK